MKGKLKEPELALRTHRDNWHGSNFGGLNEMNKLWHGKTEKDNSFLAHTGSLPWAGIFLEDQLIKRDKNVFPH